MQKNLFMKIDMNKHYIFLYLNIVSWSWVGIVNLNNSICDIYEIHVGGPMGEVQQLLNRKLLNFCAFIYITVFLPTKRCIVKKG